MLRPRPLTGLVVTLAMMIALGGCISTARSGSGSAGGTADVPAGMPVMYYFYTPT